MKKEFIEECWFIYGARIKNYFFGRPIYYGSGTAGGVDFDWKKAMHPLLIGWIHTHPGSFGIIPSETDNSTMRGWVRGRGKAFLCGIRCGDEVGWYAYFRGPSGVINRITVEMNSTAGWIWGRIN